MEKERVSKMNPVMIKSCEDNIERIKQDIEALDKARHSIVFSGSDGHRDYVHKANEKLLELKFWAEYNLKYLIKRLEDDKEVA